MLKSLTFHWFKEADYHIADYEGIGFQIHQLALEAAEEIYQQIMRENSRAISRWRKVFRTNRVDLYIKKLLAMEALPLASAYLYLRHLAREGHPPVQLVGLDSPLNRLVVPLLQRRYPEPAIRVNGLSRLPWRIVVDTLAAQLNIVEYFAKMAALIYGRRLAFRSDRHHYKISKEILWGIGNGRRNDDFIVDGDLILPQEILFYHRRSSSARMARPELLETSLANAAALGYKCVNFDRTSIPISLIWRIILPRYVIFPIVIQLTAMVRQIIHPSAGQLSHIITAFLGNAVPWELFLTSYAPRINLSQDDPYVHHIAETAVLNLYDAQNAGFQWSDDTTFRDVLLAYAGFNLYFAWGSLAEKYWEGNWSIDRVVYTGYLWGHYCQESLAKREEVIRSLIGDDRRKVFVVALFDEKLDNWSVSEEHLRDFYKVGTELLDRRPDTLVIAKPKGDTRIRNIPKVMELLSPYLDSGRLVILEPSSTDVQEVIAISDVVVSMIMGVPYLEAICCGTSGFNYAPTKNHSSPIYSRAHGKIVFDDVDSLVNAIDRALDHPEENAWAEISDLIDEVDPYRDWRGIDRMRSNIRELCDRPRAAGREHEPLPVPSATSP